MLVLCFFSYLLSAPCTEFCTLPIGNHVVHGCPCPLLFSRSCITFLRAHGSMGLIQPGFWLPWWPARVHSTLRQQGVRGRARPSDMRKQLWVRRKLIMAIEVGTLNGRNCRILGVHGSVRSNRQTFGDLGLGAAMLGAGARGRPDRSLKGEICCRLTALEWKCGTRAW